MIGRRRLIALLGLGSVGAVVPVSVCASEKVPLPMNLLAKGPLKDKTQLELLADGSPLAIEIFLNRERDLFRPGIYVAIGGDPLKRDADIVAGQDGLYLHSYCAFDGTRSHCLSLNDLKRAYLEPGFRKTMWAAAKEAVLPVDARTPVRAHALATL